MARTAWTARDSCDRCAFARRAPSRRRSIRAPCVSSARSRPLDLARSISPARSRPLDLARAPPLTPPRAPGPHPPETQPGRHALVQAPAVLRRARDGGPLVRDEGRGRVLDQVSERERLRRQGAAQARRHRRRRLQDHPRGDPARVLRSRDEAAGRDARPRLLRRARLGASPADELRRAARGDDARPLRPQASAVLSAAAVSRDAPPPSESAPPPPPPRLRARRPRVPPPLRRRRTPPAPLPRRRRSSRRSSSGTSTAPSSRRTCRPSTRTVARRTSRSSCKASSASSSGTRRTWRSAPRRGTRGPG